VILDLRFTITLMKRSPELYVFFNYCKFSLDCKEVFFIVCQKSITAISPIIKHCVYRISNLKAWCFWIWAYFLPSLIIAISNNRTRTTDYDNDSIIWGGRLKIETEKNIVNLVLLSCRLLHTRPAQISATRFSLVLGCRHNVPITL
jgi:hypothetical protein